jgi:succinate-semialdehyde dehydrogenase / glutarate-semialdehyde dehydrogenase
MRAYSEQLFGPVAAVYGVASDDEAVELANVTSSGRRDGALQRPAARAVCGRPDRRRHGLDQPAAPTQADLPFGGVKRSGFGRELSRLGMYGFTNRKLVRTFPPVTA